MEDILPRLKSCRVVAGFSVHDVDSAVPIVDALLAGGIDCVELTCRTLQAIDAIKKIAAERPDVCLGVGTVLTPEQAVQVKEAGAHFAVAPGFNRRVVRAAQAAGLPFAPGIMTPSDIEAAIEEGCRVLKFFPAVASGGASLLKSMSGPYKHLNIQYFPLGGVKEENMSSFLEMDNVCAVGGSWIVRQDLVEKQDWDGITAVAAAAVAAAAVAAAEKC
jgi:2-dehydro-3-deoxyphosphogluconate aldolase/(4S)-4-hydroxy-2-oxoglutarate aldolase